MQTSEYATYTDESLCVRVADSKKNLKQQTGMFSKIICSQKHSLYASHAVS